MSLPTYSRHVGVIHESKLKSTKVDLCLVTRCLCKVSYYPSKVSNLVKVGQSHGRNEHNLILRYKRRKFISEWKSLRHSLL